LRQQETTIPYKRQKLREIKNNRLFTKGKRKKILNNLKRKLTLLREELEYIKKYQEMYKRVLQQTKKKRDNDRYVTEASNKTKAMWQLISREIGKTQDDYKVELKVGNDIISNPMVITEKLNMYFMNIMAELVKQNINKGSYNNSRHKIKHCPNSIFISPLIEEEVVSLAKNLKDKLTAGYDDTPESLVKQCIQLIKGPLTHLYNVSLRSEVFPDECKLAKVKPLYKKGDRYDIQNYRPVSIISVFAKLLERLMFNRLTPFLHNIKILTDAQNGFRKGKCIGTAVQSFIEIIQEALDKGIHSTGIFIDFKSL